MEYIHTAFSWDSDMDIADILTAYLADLNFDMFEQETNKLNAYIPKEKYREEAISNLLESNKIFYSVEFKSELAKHQNWNALWESNYAPILIDDVVYIHAAFHPSIENIKYNLLIQPKMSFGTGHHDTTRLMIRHMLMLNLKNKRVLDLGSGTGVLAILAEKMGASSVLAIDNDRNCAVNAVENCMNNNCNNVTVLEGDIDNLEKSNYSIILANINKNVILDYLAQMATALKSDSSMVLSGFYETDLLQIEKEAKKYNLELIEKVASNNWCAALFNK